jgi:glycosyltransferase involved in cell wall biosynthesis
MKKELTKFFEYMNAGLPIICSNFPVWKDFVETHECGIAIDPTKDEEIREAITFLQENPEEAKRMGENGKKAVMNELNWGTQEKKLVDWYVELLSIEKPKQEGIDV